jgi:hypothetical protein
LANTQEKKLTGYFSINGKPMTHEQVVRAVNYAVDKGMKRKLIFQMKNYFNCLVMNLIKNIVKLAS